jgi:hypothetical protein
MIANQLLVGLIALGSIALSAGCSAGSEGADAAHESVAESEEALTAADCENCVTAHECCEAVTDRPICNFDPPACYAADPGRQATRIRNCRVYIRTAVSAWNLSGRTPPAECKITW